VGDELGIPVYLYEEAAARPERKNLEKIRKGEYELLKAEIGENPDREPDYGPARLGTAGATVIGARPFLIAFNVYLTSDDISIAKNVARAVRHSSGGLRFVKALGMLVEGRAQVSMNLTNFQLTPVAQVVEMIRREANRYGVEIQSSELVGLIPQDALLDAAQWYLQLDRFESEQVLEYRIAAAKQEVSKGERSALQDDKRFLEALASSQPTPGGGSASAFSGAAGAALVAMMARVTIGKKKYAAIESEMRSVLENAERLRASLTQDVERDALAFNRVMDAYKMPKETVEQRTLRGKAIQEATLGAAQVPLDVAGKAVEVIELAKTVVTEGNLNAISDGATGAVLARAALTGAGYNVLINTDALEARETARALVFELAALETRASEIETHIRKSLENRGGISLA
jgi:glutamate formiminotransferase/formiminotetrahydrofolate cyclodeaminase